MAAAEAESGNRGSIRMSMPAYQSYHDWATRVAGQEGVRKVAAKLVGRTDAEDVIQSALTDLLGAGPASASDPRWIRCANAEWVPALPLLMKTVKYRALNHLRGGGRRQVRDVAHEQRRPADDPLRDILRLVAGTSGDAPVTRKAVLSEVLQQVMECVTTASQPGQQYVRERYFDGLGVGEIAEKHNKKHAGTVSRLIDRALAEIRSCLLATGPNGGGKP